MKPKIACADLAWAAAFARIEEGQKFVVGEICYAVEWKHHDPDWVILTYRGEKRKQERIVRKGDPLLLELRHE